MISNIKLIILVLFVSSVKSGDIVNDAIDDLRKLCGSSACLNDKIATSFVTPYCCGVLSMECCYELTVLSKILIGCIVIGIILSIIISIACCCCSNNRRRY